MQNKKKLKEARATAVLRWGVTHAALQFVACILWHVLKLACHLFCICSVSECLKLNLFHLVNKKRYWVDYFQFHSLSCMTCTT